MGNESCEERGFHYRKNVREKEHIREERNTKEIKQRRENIDNRSAAGEAVLTRTSETGVTRKAWKVPVTSTTRTRDATKNMQAKNALLICSGKKDNRSRKVKSNMTQTRKEKKTSKDERKAESTRTLIQRIKAIKTSKVKKSTETVNSSKGEKVAYAKETNLKQPETKKTNEMEESPKIEAVRTENEGNKTRNLECNIMWVKKEDKKLKTTARYIMACDLHCRTKH